MMTVKIEMTLDVHHNGVQQMITIPHNARIELRKSSEGYMAIAFRIYGKLWRPQLKDIQAYQRLYDVKAYRAVAEYMRGDTLLLTLTSF